MVTETMVVIAIRQKNWEQVSAMSEEIAKDDSSGAIGLIRRAAKMAATDHKAAYLLTILAELRWNELNGGGCFR